MKKIIRLGAILFSITATTGLILGFIQHVTLGPIEKAQLEEKNHALAITLPAAESFDNVALAENAGMVTEVSRGTAKDGSPAGYSITVTPKGYGGLITMVVGLNTEGIIQDIMILQSGETPGLGACASEPAFAGQFHDKKIENELTVTKTPVKSSQEIQAISGATITSRAVTGAVNAAHSYWKAHLMNVSNEEAR